MHRHLIGNGCSELLTKHIRMPEIWLVKTIYLCFTKISSQTNHQEQSTLGLFCQS